ncbi:MAG: Na/Pi cotransporter family protein, partial [Clostridia bacterium]|nr:Na/Pi cotransporter family protein [Clostridia bacterium]
MTVFDIISLFGGLAMFLYGMRLLGNSLKEGSSGALKVALEKFTSNQVKAFLLGLLVTVVIQSSTATIVITAGLVAAGIIAFDKSLGIIVGANVGTTITGQIIRLLDVQSDFWAFKIFEPSTLAPLALVVGIILIMSFKFKRSNVIGNILIGFGILFMGLITMRNSVEVLNESGVLTDLLTGLGDQPVLSYLSGAAVSFILQSSSATVGILQALAKTEGILFNSLYVMLTGIYLGDCVTTAIVCWIGAKSEARKVGLFNIIYNLSKTALVLIIVNILHLTGVLDGLWDMVMTSGTIANTNSVFNLGCAIILLPLVGVFGKLSKMIITDKSSTENEYTAVLDGLNPVFYSTPALALRSCYDVLRTSLDIACKNIALS